MNKDILKQLNECFMLITDSNIEQLETYGVSDPTYILMVDTGFRIDEDSEVISVVNYSNLELSISVHSEDSMSTKFFTLKDNDALPELKGITYGPRF